MSEYPTNGLGAVPGLTAFPDKGNPKGERLKDAASLHSIWEQMQQDDKVSALQRNGIRAMIDGQPPFNEAALRRAGAANRSNLNFGEADARLSQSLTGYNDMLESVPVFIMPELPLTMFDDATRVLNEDVIAQEFTTMIRDEPWFDSRWQVCAKEFVEHGVSLFYFPEDRDWKPDTCGWDSFCIPRSTRAEEQHVDVICMERAMLPSDLYKKIANEKAANDVGWNVEAVRRALVRATKYGPKAIPRNWGVQWQDLQMALKSNDLYVNNQNNARVHLVHAWVKEYDGTYSHYIIERDGCYDGKGQQEFLYKAASKFPNAQNCFTIFCLNIGDGYYHTIRGQGYKMYPFVQTSNKTRNGVLDNLRLSMLTMLQPKDVGGLDESPMTISGSFALLSPEVDFIERDFQDHSRTTLPVLADFERMMQNVSPTYQPRGISRDRQARTMYELQAEQGLESTLTVASMNMFYRSWRRALREMFRRVQEIIRAQLWEEFPEVLAFAQRCAMQGVIPETILAVERIYEKRAIGAGSPGQRQAIQQRLMSRISMYDEVGRANLLRDMTVSDVGVREANRYVPPALKPRPVADQKIAELENAVMFKGTDVPPLEGENHAVHTQTHLPAIAQAIQTLEDWRNGGEQGDIQDLQPQIAFLSLLIPHTEQHVAAMGSDPTRAEEAGNARKALQEYAAMWMTYVRQLEKALDEQKQNENAQAQPDPVKLAKIEEIKLKMQQSVQAFQTSEQLKVADVQHRMMIRQKEADQKMAIALNKHNAETVMDSELPPASQSDLVTNRSVHTPMR